jgi:hypothetical protein
MSTIKACFCLLCDLNNLEDEMLIVEGLDAVLASGSMDGEYIPERPVEVLYE